MPKKQTATSKSKPATDPSVTKAEAGQPEAKTKAEDTTPPPKPEAETAAPPPETTPASTDNGSDEQAATPVAESPPTPEEIIKQLEDDKLRLKAENANQAKRLYAAIDDAKKRGAEEIFSGLLAIADNLERALAQETDNVTSLREGISMTLNQLQQFMQTNDIKVIEPKEGDKLDPECHTAILQEKHATLAANLVIRTIAKGYRSPQRILRAAQVVVALPPEPATKDNK